MKVVVLQENLEKIVSIASRFVAVRPQAPILSHFLILAKRGRVIIAATDLDTGVEIETGARVDKEGVFAVPAKVFSELVSSLPQEKVELGVEKELLRLVCGEFRAQLQGVAASEFPKFPVKKREESQEIGVGEMTEAMDKVVFAASSDETRPVLTGVYFDIEGKKPSLVATDGYRLSLVRLGNSGGLLKGGSFLVGAGVFNEVAKIFDELKQEKMFLGLSAEQRQMFIEGESIRVVTRLLEGEFPAYKKIIPQENKLEIKVNREELRNAVRVAAIFARDSANIIRWKIKDGVLLVEANSPQVGRNTVKVAIEMIRGKEGEIAFNSRYLLDFLTHTKSEAVRFEMNEALQPGLFKEDMGFEHVIMPVRVQEGE